MTPDIVERLRENLEMSHHLQLRYEAAAEIERLRTLARDAYEEWDNDRDSKVGKLLRAMLDGKFCAAYRPDLPHNEQGNGPLREAGGHNIDGSQRSR